MKTNLISKIVYSIRIATFIALAGFAVWAPAKTFAGADSSQIIARQNGLAVLLNGRGQYFFHNTSNFDVLVLWQDQLGEERQTTVRARGWMTLDNPITKLENVEDADKSPEPAPYHGYR